MKAFHNWFTSLLLKNRPVKHSLVLADFKRLSYEIRPGDVILVSGRSRASEIIKTITQSHWSHAALYIGRLHDIKSLVHRNLVEEHYPSNSEEKDTQLLIESEIGKGTVVSPLNVYKDDHLRICRPRGLQEEDAYRLINYCIERIGREYDVRQMFDLARFLFPWTLLPRRFRSSLFKHSAGTPTKEVCSTLIARAFADIKFPILPRVCMDDTQERVEFIRRNPRLYTPSDFDFSPYFDIIKYPMFGMDSKNGYRDLTWSETEDYSDEAQA